MPKLAVIILTKNEEKNIEDCIRSASFADEIVVIDSGSTDRTQELAEAAGARFIVHPMAEAGFAGQRNFALKQTDAEWIFYLDADERITAEAAGEIQGIVQQNECAAYRIRRMNIVFCQMMKHGAHRPDYVQRLFPRTNVTWIGQVHEHVETELPVRSMRHALEHHTYDNWNRYFLKLGQYTDLMADKMHEQGRDASLMDISIRPLYAFFRAYILQRGLLDGELGFVFSVLHGYYTFMKYVKLRYRY